MEELQSKPATAPAPTPVEAEVAPVVAEVAPAVAEVPSNNAVAKEESGAEDSKAVLVTPESEFCIARVSLHVFMTGFTGQNLGFCQNLFLSVGFVLL